MFVNVTHIYAVRAWLSARKNHSMKAFLVVALCGLLSGTLLVKGTHNSKTKEVIQTSAYSGTAPYRKFPRRRFA